MTFQPNTGNLPEPPAGVQGFSPDQMSSMSNSGQLPPPPKGVKGYTAQELQDMGVQPTVDNKGLNTARGSLGESATTREQTFINNGKTWTPPADTGMQGFAEGVGQSEIETVQNVGGLVQKGLQKGGGFLQRLFGMKPTLESASQFPGAWDIYNKESQAGKVTASLSEAQTPSQKFGKVVGTVAPYLIPGLGGAEGAIDTTIAATELPGLVKTALSVGSKAALEGTTAGGIALGQTADPKQALTTALTFGLLKGTTSAIGTGLKAMGVPEHLYSTVFKTASRDMLDELKSGGIANLQKTNPDLFKQFVDNGIIKTAKDGSYTVDETLAKQALDRGLKGSIKNMSNVVVKNTLQNEADAQSIASNYKGTVSIPGADKLKNVLTTVSEDYKDVGQGEISNKAKALADAVSGGDVNAKQALDLRRFLDGMRYKSSYNPDVKLSTTAENFKYWSDAVRGKLNAIPGMGNVMKDYSFNIDALNSLAKTAASRGNQQLVNMLDVLVFEGGIQEGAPGLGAGMSIFRKALTTPGAATRIGSAIERSGASTGKGMATKALISEATRANASNQEQP